MPIDYTRYPKNWKSEIVPRVLKRANNYCEVCGIANKDQRYSVKMWVKCPNPKKNQYKLKTLWLGSIGEVIRLSGYTTGLAKEIKVVLTIAHLDHDETNHQVKDERLLAMCQMCHLNYDAKEKYRRAIGG